MDNKTLKQKKVVDNLKRFYHSREEVFNFFRDYTKLFFDASYETKQTGLNYQLLNKCFKDHQ